MTIYNLMQEISVIRKFIKEYGNNCDGTVELYEDHLSDLLEDLREKLVIVEDELKKAKVNDPYHIMEETLTDLRNQIIGVLNNN